MFKICSHIGSASNCLGNSRSISESIQVFGECLYWVLKALTVPDSVKLLIAKKYSKVPNWPLKSTVSLSFVIRKGGYTFPRFGNSFHYVCHCRHLESSTHCR
jgi:hypothetical protein